MILVERHIIKKSHKSFKDIDLACFGAKNIFNMGLYLVKQEYEKSGVCMDYYALEKMLKTEYSECYYSISPASAQQVLLGLYRDCQSFFAALKSYQSNPNKFLGCPEFPRYKNKKFGRHLLVYSVSNQLRFRDDMIVFPKKDRIKPLKTNVLSGIQQVRFVPKDGHYVVEVVYRYQEDSQQSNNDRVMSIDLGVNNFATCFSNVGNALIFSGKPLLSINQYYDKNKARLQENIPSYSKRRTTKKIKSLTFKRNNKVKDYVHKVSKNIVQVCKNQGISEIIIGKNREWKQKIKLGRTKEIQKRNNRNFSQIPHNMLVNQLVYKGLRAGIMVRQIGESHTSKCSALDMESIEHHDVYVGKRVKRDLFKTKTGKLLNADMNGAMNIYRRGTNDMTFNKLSVSIGFVFNPVKFKIAC